MGSLLDCAERLGGAISIRVGTGSEALSIGAGADSPGLVPGADCTVSAPFKGAVIMPNRTISESACVSESLAAVSSDAEVLFWRMTTKADDYGRYDARVAVIRGAAFSLDLKRWTEARVAACLDELEAQDLIRRYEAEGRECLVFPTWSTYQRTRVSAKSKYPAPPGDLQPLAATRGDLPQLADIRGSRDVHVPVPVHVPEVVGSEVALGSKEQGIDDFDAFWAVYPRKAGRRAARAAFDKAVERVSVGDLIAAAERYRDDPNREDGFTAHPTTWLNQGRWDDDPLPSRATDNGSRLRHIAEMEATREAL